MTKTIVKRDGRTEAFDVAKIKAAIEAAMSAVHKGLTGDLAQKAVQLSEQIAQSTEDGASIESIQDSVEKGLMDAELIEEAKAYIKYRAARTDIREARTHLMKIIDSFFTEKQDDGSSHKENANINASSVSGAFYRIGSEASKDYYTRCLIPSEFVEAHTNGYLHYHDADYYGLSLNCMQHDLGKMFKKGFSTGNAYIGEPQSITSAMALTCVILQSGQTDLFGGESIPAWDFYMEPYVEKSFKKALKKHLENMAFAPANMQELWVKENGYQEHTPVFENDDLYKAYKWAKRDVEAETYQAAQAMVYNLNSLASRAGGQVVFSSINLGTCVKPGGRLATKALLKAIDDGIGKGVTSLFPIVIFKLKEGVTYSPQDPNYDLRLYSERVTAKRMFPNYSNLDAPYNLKYYKEGHPETEVAYMGCRTRAISNVNGPEIVTDRGNLSFTTLNLPRYAIEASREGTSEEERIEIFFKKLDKYLDIARRQLEHRYKIQCNRRVYNLPYVMQQGAYMGSEHLSPDDTIRKAIENGTLSFGFVGLAEALVALTGHDHTEGEKYQQLGLRIVKHMRDYADKLTEEQHMNWSLIATPAESVAGKMLRKDRAEFGVIPGVTDKDYYTNSNHVPVWRKIRASEKIRLEAPYHELTNAGHIAYVECEGDPRQNLDALHTLINIMHDAGAGYFSFNHKIDTCTNCGYNGIIGDVCPSCGQKETPSHPFVRPRRITGYLSYENRFNSAKTAELNARVTHA